jgi:N-carbamoyl-L-amino-acid hydrolase
VRGNGHSKRIQIDADRLWATLEASARIGAISATGLARLALSEADGQMRDLFVSWCEEAHLGVTVDRIGNIFARRTGALSDAAPVMIGSHLDTQVHGGRFDGILGVLAGLELMRALNAASIRTRRPVDLVCWTDEEGARFRRSMLGSSVFAGQLGLDQALALQDDRGVTVDEALTKIGYAGERAVPGSAPHAYLELHIEQDSVLDGAGIDVGIADSSIPSRIVAVHFEGRTAHSGPTPMAKRRDALLAAAHAIVAIDQIARGHGPAAKASTSTIRVWPNRPAIVPSSTDLRCNFTHPDNRVLDEMQAEIEDAVASAADAAQVAGEMVLVTRFGDAGFDAGVVGALEAAGAFLGVESMRLPAPAGHDASVIASVAPTAMIFCPCRDGISHHPDEDIDYERVLPSVAVVTQAAVSLANGADLGSAT